MRVPGTWLQTCTPPIRSREYTRERLITQVWPANTRTGVHFPSIPLQIKENNKTQRMLPPTSRCKLSIERAIVCKCDLFRSTAPGHKRSALRNGRVRLARLHCKKVLVTLTIFYVSCIPFVYVTHKFKVYNLKLRCCPLLLK